MNTIEKRKIESVINEDIQQHIAEYRNKRGDEYNKRKSKLEKQATKEVNALVSQAQKLKDEQKKIEEELNSLGWTLKSDYKTDRFCVEIATKYHWNDKTRSADFEPQVVELLEFDSETDEKIKQLQTLGRAYTLKIYAGSEEMEKIMASFSAEITRLLK